jgi:hypothetical protein
MLRRLILLVLLLACMPRPAQAGQTAHYRNREDGSTMVIEVEGGNSRLQVSNRNWYVLTTGGETYGVYDLPSGFTVMRLADLQRIFEERRLILPVPQADPSVQIVARGRTSVGGQSGLAYHLRIGRGISPMPFLVVSNAPALAPLGPPFTRQLDLGIMLARLQGQTVPPIFVRARELIGTGTALIVAGFVLERIDPAPIDAARFVVPAEPLPLEQMRRNIEANSPTT